MNVIINSYSISTYKKKYIAKEFLYRRPMFSLLILLVLMAFKNIYTLALKKCCHNWSIEK